MLAKLGAKNQLTLPKAIIQQIDAPEYFDVSLENGRIILTPFTAQTADSVRGKLEKLGITEHDIEDAVRWSRNR